MVKSYCYFFKCYLFDLFDWRDYSSFAQNIILDDKNNEDDKKKAYIDICSFILFGRII